MFMEQVDYKMEIEDPSQNSQLVLLKQEEFSEQERREAFKKKLRKYSGRHTQEENAMLP